MVRAARVIAPVLVTALLATGCGTRLSNEEIEAAADGMGRPGGAVPGGRGGAPVPSEGGPVTFGDLPSPCGPGDASGATEVGVTDDEITIVTIADPGGVRPGLNQGVFDTMKAFGEWCNAQGGINGRRLNVVLRDAQLTDYQAQVAYACEHALALVGGIGVLDQTGVQDQLDCGLPNIPAAAVSPEQTSAGLTVQPLPNPVDRFLVGPGRWIAGQHPEAPGRAAALRTKLSILEIQSDRYIEGYEQIGYDFVFVDSANVSETNWSPLVLAMKNEGVTYLTLTSSYEEIIPLQKEMALQGFDPVVELEANFYNAKYPQQAGDTAEGTYVRLTVWPFEEADRNPAMAEYLRVLREVVPEAEPELLGVQAWSAALLWATAVKNLGSEVTRERLMEELTRITDWTGGGLHGPGNPAANEPGGCFIVMQVADGAFVRRYPLPDEDAEVYRAGNGFACPHDSMVELTGDYGQGGRAGG